MNPTSRWTSAWAALPTLALGLLTACGGGGGASPAGDNNGNVTDAPVATPFVAVGSSARTASLGWKPVTGATGYTLERKTATAAFVPI
ncbi:MAG TPA: hypothetical protein VFO28_13430, partial [Burkholderiaceae bacterium]|nr:hypothetical protein [Burkholderiaceae bacterium]